MDRQVVRWLQRPWSLGKRKIFQKRTGQVDEPIHRHDTEKSKKLTYLVETGGVLVKRDRPPCHIAITSRHSLSAHSRGIVRHLDSTTRAHRLAASGRGRGTRRQYRPRAVAAPTSPVPAAPSAAAAQDSRRPRPHVPTPGLHDHPGATTGSSPRAVPSSIQANGIAGRRARHGARGS